MKIFTYLLLVILLLSCSKSKSPVNKKCYKCEAISQGNFYNETPCTNGDPYENLAKKDPNGNLLGWSCTEQ